MRGNWAESIEVDVAFARDRVLVQSPSITFKKKITLQFVVVTAARQNIGQPRGKSQIAHMRQNFLGRACKGRQKNTLIALRLANSQPVNVNPVHPARQRHRHWPIVVYAQDKYHIGLDHSDFMQEETDE